MSGAQSGGGVPFGPPPALCEHNKRPQQAVHCPSAEHIALAVKLTVSSEATALPEG